MEECALVEVKYSILIILGFLLNQIFLFFFLDGVVLIDSDYIKENKKGKARRSKF